MMMLGDYFVVSSPDPALKEGKGLVHIKCFLGRVDAAYHVIGMITHRFGMATHQPLSHAALYSYGAMSHDNHM